MTHSDHLPALNLLPTSHHPCWLCSSWLESPSTSKSRFAESGTLTSCMTRLPEVGCSAGWDLKVATDLPDLQFKGVWLTDKKLGSCLCSSKSKKGNGIISFLTPGDSQHVTWKGMITYFISFIGTCCCWKLQKPSGSFWWARQCLLQRGADGGHSEKIYSWGICLCLDGREPS